MLHLVICYDISTRSKAGRRRLRQAAQACALYGVRVQASVFECSLDQADWENLRLHLLGILHHREDSLVCYFLHQETYQKTERHGRRNQNLHTALDAAAGNALIIGAATQTTQSTQSTQSTQTQTQQIEVYDEQRSQGTKAGARAPKSRNTNKSSAKKSGGFWDFWRRFGGH